MVLPAKLASAKCIAVLFCLLFVLFIYLFIYFNFLFFFYCLFNWSTEMA